MPRPQQMHMIPVDHMVAEAVAFIRQYEPPEGYFVGFSGGKDSIATLRLIRMAGVKHQAFYSATGIDPPELVSFIKTEYPNVKWLRPKHSFWSLILTNSPPMRVSRWCCDRLKKDCAKEIDLKHRILGLRAEESTARARYPRIDYHKKFHQWLYKPIFYWKEWHVWDFIEQHGLLYPSLYDEGFGRLGCVVCPFVTDRNLRRHKARWPKFYRTFEHAVHRWFSPERCESSELLQRFHIRTVEQYLKFWYGEQRKAFPEARDCCRVITPFEVGFDEQEN